MVDWTESLTRRAGVDPDPLARAVRLVAGRGGSAQLCVLHGDRVLIDRRFGCRPEALFWLFSTSKPLVALLVHRLAERGLLDLDEPLARYWPEFAARGKQHVTVRHVLAHRSGLPLAHHSIAVDSLAMVDGPRFVRALARARPWWAAGTVPACHIISYAYLLGELVRRLTGRPAGAVLREELLDPLRLGDIHRDAFGHNGSNACLAWADPTRDLVFVHLGNVFAAGHEGARYLAEVSDAVLAAVDGGRRIGGRER